MPPSLDTPNVGVRCHNRPCELSVSPDQASGRAMSQCPGHPESSSDRCKIKTNKGDAFIYAVWSANVVKSLGTGPSKGSKASREHSRSRGTGTPLLVPMPSHPRMAYNPHFQIGSVFYTTSNTPIGRQSGVAVMRD